MLNAGWQLIAVIVVIILLVIALTAWGSRSSRS
jgi:hypothetical protein